MWCLLVVLLVLKFWLLVWVWLSVVLLLICGSSVVCVCMVFFLLYRWVDLVVESCGLLLCVIL